jgi:hypothetical protein
LILLTRLLLAATLLSALSGLLSLLARVLLLATLLAALVLLTHIRSLSGMSFNQREHSDAFLHGTAILALAQPRELR